MATITTISTHDTLIDGHVPTKNYEGDAWGLLVGDRGGADKARSLLRFTLPSNPGGSITKITLFIYNYMSNNVAQAINVYSENNDISREWVANQATWNIYKTGTNWTVAGGGSDFGSTIHGSTATIPHPTATPQYYGAVIQGTGATNSLSLNWGDTINLFLRSPTLNANKFFRDNTTANQEPYLEIEYTGSASKKGFLVWL